MNAKRLSLSLAFGLGVLASTGAQAIVAPQDVFLAVYDSANTWAYVFDTGLHADTDLGVTSATFTLNDQNWQDFLSLVGPNAVLNWSVNAYSMQAGINTKAWWTTADHDMANPIVTNVVLSSRINNMVLGLTTSGIDVAGGVFSEVAGSDAPNYFGNNYAQSYYPNRVDGGPQLIDKLAVSDTAHVVSRINTFSSNEYADFLHINGGYTLFLTAGSPELLQDSSPLPEPGGWALAVVGLSALAWRARRRGGR